MKQVDEQLNITRVSVETWHEMVAAGYDQPVDVPTNGISMWPMLRNRGDGIKIVAPYRPLRLGDVIMFESKSGKSIAHRICWMDGDRLQTLGDNCTDRDEIITMAQVYGIATHIRRKTKYIAIDNRFWHIYGRFMTVTSPFRMFIKNRLYHPVKIWLWRCLKGHK